MAILKLLVLAAITPPFALIPIFAALFTFGARRAITRAGNWALHQWARLACLLCGIRVRRVGEIPKGTCLFASNHVGVLDIPVLAAAYPALFLSMAEVNSWPLVGQLARLAGTLFVVRKRSDVERVVTEMERHLAQGFSITFFPEGRASSGARVERFHPALFEAALRAGVPSVPVTVNYATPGSPDLVSRRVCWLEAPFAEHAMGLLKLRRIEAEVSLGEPVAPPARDGSSQAEGTSGGSEANGALEQRELRRTLAEQLHAKVAERFRPLPQPASEEAALPTARKSSTVDQASEKSLK